jgi:hypothetical protein
VSTRIVFGREVSYLEKPGDMSMPRAKNLVGLDGGNSAISRRAHRANCLLP